MCVTGAVGVRIVINDIALTTIEIGAINGGIACCECVAAGIGDCWHGDAVGGDIGQAMDRGFTVSGRDSEVLGNDMVSVSPGMSCVVDGVVEGIDRVTASTTADKCRIGKGERNVTAAYSNSRCGGSMDIADAMDIGVGISYRCECLRLYGIDKLPRVIATSTIGVGVIVGDDAVSVVSHVNNRITGGSNGSHFSAAGIDECVNDGLACHVGTCNDAGAVLGHSQCGQADDVGIGPVVTMACAVGEGVSISDRTLAVCHSGVDDRLVMTD